MNKKSILAAVFLIFVGVVLGAIVVSSFRGGVEPGFAGDPQVKLGAPSQIKNGSADTKGLSKAFIDVSKAVTPTVVAITVTTKAKKGSSDDMNDFFRFFGPNFKAPDQEPQQGAGSGFIISPEGYILTNNHVVDEADPNGIEVVMSNQHRMKGKVVGTDPTTDLAVVKVDGSDLPTAAFGNSDNLQVGEWVVAIGNPLGLQSTVTAGIVSAIGRQIGIIQETRGYGIENFIQTDAAINPGNSGGPLVNLNGEVIGINAAIATTNARYQGYGFAIPINLAKTVAEDLIKYGKVRRGYLGVRIATVDETTAKALGMDKPEGVMVESLEADGAAASGGLKEKDVILSVDGREVNAANELQTLIARKHPGDQVSLKIYRDGNTLTKTLTLRSLATEKLAASNTDQNSDESNTETEQTAKSADITSLGMSLRSLSAAEKKDDNVEQGVVITDVKRFGEAYNRRLQVGDVILEADKKELYSPKDFKSVMEKHKPGDALLLRVKTSTGTAFVAVQIPNE